MFYILTIVSVFAYALQGALLASLVRKKDPLVIATWRNTSLMITMLPFLWIAGMDSTMAVVPWIPNLIVAGFFGAVFLWLQFEAFIYLPVGIVTSLRQSVRVILSILMGALFWGEILGWAEVGLILVILSGCTLLGRAKNQMPHLNEKSVTGLLLCILSGGFHVSTYFFMGRAAKNIHPLVAGYFWEFLIGCCCWILLICRKWYFGKSIISINRKEFFLILLISSPTLVGTGLSVYAITLGSFAEFSAIGSVGLIFSSFFGMILYQERLKIIQWSGVLVCVLGILGLSLV